MTIPSAWSLPLYINDHSFFLILAYISTIPSSWSLPIYQPFLLPDFCLYISMTIPPSWSLPNYQNDYPPAWSSPIPACATHCRVALPRKTRGGASNVWRRAPCCRGPGEKRETEDLVKRATRCQGPGEKSRQLPLSRCVIWKTEAWECTLVWWALVWWAETATCLATKHVFRGNQLLHGLYIMLHVLHILQVYMLHGYFTYFTCYMLHGYFTYFTCYMDYTSSLASLAAPRLLVQQQVQ